MGNGKLYFAAAARNVNDVGESLFQWAKGAYPSGVSLPTLTVTGEHVMVLPSGGSTPCDIYESFLQFEFTSEQMLSNVTKGLQIAVGIVVPYFSSATATLKARIRVNETDRLSEVWLRAVDVDNGANNDETLVALTDNTWINGSLSFNNTSWNANGIGLCVSFRGTTNSANVGLTRIGIQYIMYSA